MYNRPLITSDCISALIYYKDTKNSLNKQTIFRYEDIRAKELIYENRPYPRTVIQPKLLENIIYQEREVALPIRKDSIKTTFRS